jgi:transcriptional regulator with XRE-family HTH domain
MGRRLLKIARLIKKLRLHLCCEQEEFGKMLGVTNTTISHYELGHRLPRIAVRKKILELAKKHKFKMSPKDFEMNEDDEM